jgi:ABC-2 type transport system permease protein
MLLSGLFLPLDELPEPVRQVADVSPLTAVLHLLRLGLRGETAEGTTVTFLGSFAHAAAPLLALVAWTLVAAWATRRWFRWEPRR